MTKMKERAVEILQDIPDDKLAPVIEILQGLRALYAESGQHSAKQVTPDSVMGICGKYANPALIPLEKEAWGEAVKEKYVTH